MVMESRRFDRCAKRLRCALCGANRRTLGGGRRVVAGTGCPFELALALADGDADARQGLCGSIPLGAAATLKTPASDSVQPGRVAFRTVRARPAANVAG
jgi:hypothetical protein